LAEAKTKTTTTTSEVKILVPDHQPMVALVGQADELLKLVERAFEARIVVRGNEITISGAAGEVERAALLFEELLALLEQGHELSTDSLGRTIDMIKDDDSARPTQVFGDTLLTVRGRTLRPKTFGQKRYVDAIRKTTITFGIGPAGTGKTYLAVAAAVKALQERDVMRIILTRPAVEAGERLGFLPGTLYEKIDPYLKPLYDAMFDMMDTEAFNRLMERGTIEVAPLAYMRGRTLNDSFIILDEAQNTTPEQMKMFLTRLGFGSKAVVTGDVTQIDLPTGQRSGIVVVEEILKDIEGIEFVRLGARDVVRHKIVQDIVEAYRVFSERPAKT
jgi:phosphate starvation-inducible protein PhoH and related proteins